MLSFLFALCLCTPFLEANCLSAMSPFFISPEGTGKQTVELVEGDSKFSCTFSFDTTSEEAKPSKQTVSPVDLVRSLQSKYDCLEKQHADWRYKVCLGGEITQFYPQQANQAPNPNAPAPEIYVLGKFDRNEQATGTKAVQTVYSDGTQCQQQGPRHTIVYYTCSAEPMLTTIEETQMCSYKIGVGLPEICSHPDFAQQVVAGNDEAWFVQLARMGDGRLECSVQHSGYGSIGRVALRSFSLQFADSLAASGVRLRQANRVALLPEEFAVQLDGVVSTAAFKRSLYFASISHVVSDTV
eukprot:TRINITY_DN9114_c0_g1_i1.p1 TRINITY_DN9114_c0_g1~~TRINITY_DN9114_c0_g1_i1.p1  ORF type:complete len:311 (-),score=25.07 TRINITY_DN9114_c0_g1_i1:11-904(-)